MASSPLNNGSPKRPYSNLSHSPSESPSKLTSISLDQGDIRSVAQGLFPLPSSPSASGTRIRAVPISQNPTIQHVAQENLALPTQTAALLERNKTTAKSFFLSGKENLAAGNYLDAIDDFGFSREYYGQVPDSNLEIVTCSGLIAGAYLEVAKSFVESGDYMEAILEFTDALQNKMLEYMQYQTFFSKDYEYEALRIDIGHIRLQIGLCHFHLGEYEKAQQQLKIGLGHFDEAINHFEKDKSSPFLQDAMEGFGNTLSLMGEVEANKENYIKAIDCYNKSLEVLYQKDPINLITINKCKRDKSSAHVKQSDICNNNGDSTNANFHLNQALTTITSIMDEKGEIGEDEVWIADLHNDLALIYYKTKNFSKSIEHFEKALSLRTTLFGVEEYNVQMTKFELALSHKGKGDELALSDDIEHHYEQAITLLESIKIQPDQMDIDSVTLLQKTDHLLCNILESLGSLNVKNKNFGKSNECYQKALALMIKEQPTHPDKIIKCQISLAETCYELGKISVHKGEFSQAIEHFKKEFSIAKSLSEAYRHNPKKYRTWFGSIHFCLGYALAETKEFSSSIEHFKKALIYRKHVFGLESPIVIITSGELAKSQIKLAQFHLTKSEDIEIGLERDVEAVNFRRDQHREHLEKYPHFVFEERNPFGKEGNLAMDIQYTQLEDAYWNQQKKEALQTMFQHQIIALDLVAKAKPVDDPQVQELINDVVNLYLQLLPS